MPEPIFDPDYWRRRLSSGPLHHSVFKCDYQRFLRIEEQHRRILFEKIGQYHGVLDVGCGYGRLLSLMPDNWKGEYLGIDLAPAMVDAAHRNHGDLISAEMKKSGLRRFEVMDVRDLVKREWEFIPRFDWAVLISVRGMIINNEGAAVWDKIQAQLHAVCERTLVLEYDVDDVGVVL